MRKNILPNVRRYMMKFIEMVKEIHNLKENEGYLVLVRCGIFFDAVGKIV